MLLGPCPLTAAAAMPFEGPIFFKYYYQATSIMLRKSTGLIIMLLQKYTFLSHEI